MGAWLTRPVCSAQANPPSYDRCQDLASLLYLNESSVMHSLRQRYGGNLIYTHAGPNLVVVNPVSTPSMYSEKVRPPSSSSAALALAGFDPLSCGCSVR